MQQKSTRRQFVKQVATVGTALAGGSALRWRRVSAAESPNERLNVAAVGIGGKGRYAVSAGSGENMVAICDVDEQNIAKALKTLADKQPGAPAPRVFYDYRKMLDEMHDEIDVVLVSTPDHHHAPACIRAIQYGKAAFSQKPLAHDIRECYELAKAAKEKNVLTQMGNQGHCGESIRRACEYLWAGAIGQVTETHSILGRNFGGSGGRPETKPVPEGLHWDQWLGPAPYREYHDGLHPFKWRSWRDFGTGTIGDMACHNIDAAFWALKVGEAKTVTVECLNTKGGSEEMYPQDNVVKYVVPARADMPELTMYVYDHGGLKPDLMKETETACNVKFKEDTLYVGEKGLFTTGGHARGAKILPQTKHDEFPPPEKTLPRAHGGPIEDLFYCLKNDETPCSNFVDSAGPLTAFVLLGHLAQFAGVGQKVEWDVEKMECTNLPELNEHVRRTYREGWEV